MSDKKKSSDNPRIVVIQKLYSYFLNKESELIIPKHKYKKFIKDTVLGTIEREELLLVNLKTILNDDFNPSRTDLILKLMILSATFELMFSHKICKSIFSGIMKNCILNTVTHTQFFKLF